MVHTSVHASWVNQVEILFSVAQRKVVSPNDFTDLDEVKQRLAAFEKRYNATATPFRWKFTRDNLNHLAQVDGHSRPVEQSVKSCLKDAPAALNAPRATFRYLREEGESKARRLVVEQS